MKSIDVKILASVLMLLFFQNPALKAEGESSTVSERKFTLTTYYPAPHGEYRHLQASGSTTDPADTVVFKAAGRNGTGLVVQNDGIVRAQSGLVIHKCSGAGCPTNTTAETGQIWFDTSVK